LPVRDKSGKALAGPDDSARNRWAVYDDPDALADEWEELADRSAAPPFARPGWVRAWWGAFGAGSFELVTTRTDGHLTGVVPLYRPAVVMAQYKTEPLPVTARHGTLRSISNWHVPEFRMLAEDIAAAAQLAEVCVGRARVLSLGLLNPVEHDLASFVEAAERAGFNTLIERHSPSPYLTIDGDWETYESALSTRLLRDLRRRRRRLEEEGSVTVEVAEGDDRLDALLDEGFRIEPSGWKAARRAAIVSRPETRRFYTELAHWAAGRGWLRLAFLRVGGRAIAFQFALEHDRQYYFLKGGFDPAFERFAPSKILVHDMLERAFQIGLQRYNFLGGNEAWKLEWTATCRERVVLHAFSPTWLGNLDRLLIGYGRPLRARARARFRFLRPVAARLGR